MAVSPSGRAATAGKKEKQTDVELESPPLKRGEAIQKKRKKDPDVQSPRTREERKERNVKKTRGSSISWESSSLGVSGKRGRNRSREGGVE